MARTQEQIRESKRLFMARKRAANPEAVRQYHRERHHKNRDYNTAKMRNYYAKRFFWGRAMKLRGLGRATTKDLASMWHRQHGVCALTGRRLDRTAQLDHILPQARGGNDSIGNLRWVCQEVNIAKRHMTDEEFFNLCGSVMYWLGQRIEQVDRMLREGK